MNEDNNKKTPIRRGNVDGFIVGGAPRQPKSRPSANRLSKPKVESLNIDAMPKRSTDNAPVAFERNRSFSPAGLGSTGNNTISAPKKPKKKKHVKRYVILSIVSIFILAIGFGGWDAWQLYHKLHKLSVGNLTKSVGGAENILVAGSTNRCNLTVQNAEWGFCTGTDTGDNSDVIFIVHLVPATHSVSVLSIPRDTFVPNARSGNEAFKIDAALYQGPTQLVTAVEQDFGIPIQHYVEVGFDGFVNIVNAIGGVNMNFPMPVYDAESYLKVLTPGCYKLNGVQALQVIRARHLQYKAAGITTNDFYYWPQESESDIARISRTHEFLRVVATAVSKKGASDPITDQRLVDALAPQVQVDSGFSTSTIFSLLNEFRNVNINTVPQYTLPIAVAGFGNYDYEGEDMGDVVFPVESNDQTVIDQFLGATASQNTMTGDQLPAAQSISVNVINGSGVADQASQVTTSLAALGFNMIGSPGTSTPVSDQAQETVVYYSGTATEGDAIAVANKLTGYVILSQNSSMVTQGSEVTVVTGTGVGVTAAASTSPAAANSSTSTSTSSSASSASQASPSSLIEAEDSEDIAPPSAAQQALSPWDPTACTASQPVLENPNV